MFPFALPFVGAVSANAALASGAVTAVAVAGGVSEYKYKTVSRTVSYAYDSIIGYKSKEQIEREKEHAQMVLLENAFHDLMNFDKISELEVDTIAAIIDKELSLRKTIANDMLFTNLKKNEANKEYVDSLSIKRNYSYKLFGQFVEMLNDINSFHSTYRDFLSLDTDDVKNIPKLTSMRTSKNKIVHKINDIKSKAMIYYTDNMQGRLSALNSCDNKKISPRV